MWCDAASAPQGNTVGRAQSGTGEERTAQFGSMTHSSDYIQSLLM